MELIKRGFFFFTALMVLLFSPSCKGEGETTLFDFTVLDANGGKFSMSQYESASVVIVVNVASSCGYTYSNYRELGQLYEKYKQHGLEIIGFPSNQFGEQEPGSDEEIQVFVKNYGVTFPIMAKVDVNGPGATELFKFLKSKTGHNEINWNFNKFLLVKGVPVKRYVSSVKPLKMEDDIKRLLGLGEDEL